jgi:hypothetical protein
MDLAWPVAVAGGRIHFLHAANGGAADLSHWLSGCRSAAKAHGVKTDTPVLVVHRFLNFKQADNAVFSILYCNTETFVFSQQIGGASHEL